jgi:hypothetical protein
MSNVLQNYPVMLYLRHVCHILFPEWQIRFSISWVTNKPQKKHHWIIVKHFCHFVRHMILYLGPLLQCGIITISSLPCRHRPGSSMSSRWRRRPAGSGPTSSSLQKARHVFHHFLTFNPNPHGWAIKWSIFSKVNKCMMHYINYL